jgi:hypothetical protein
VVLSVSTLYVYDDHDYDYNVKTTLYDDYKDYMYDVDDEEHDDNDDDMIHFICFLSYCLRSELGNKCCR